MFFDLCATTLLPSSSNTLRDTTGPRVHCTTGSYSVGPFDPWCAGPFGFSHRHPWTRTGPTERAGGDSREIGGDGGHQDRTPGSTVTEDGVSLIPDPWECTSGQGPFGVEVGPTVLSKTVGPKSPLR